MEELIKAYRALLAAQAEAQVAAIWTAAWHKAVPALVVAEQEAAA